MNWCKTERQVFGWQSIRQRRIRNYVEYPISCDALIMYNVGRRHNGGRFCDVAENLITSLRIWKLRHPRQAICSSLYALPCLLTLFDINAVAYICKNCLQFRPNERWTREKLAMCLAIILSCRHPNDFRFFGLLINLWYRIMYHEYQI